MSTSPPRLAELTTLGLGGPADHLLVATSEAELAAFCADEDALVIGGGSNLVVGDGGIRQTAVKVALTGIDSDGPVVRISAGENWDTTVQALVAAGRCGLAALSGIPGSCGATPVQNVGAYGSEISESLDSVRLLDRRDGSFSEVPAADLRLAYRSSSLRGSSRWVVSAIRLRLPAHPRPVRYAELARALHVQVGEPAPETEVRETVLRLRRAKGMVLDPHDPDTRSAGSFFTNPILSADEFAAFGAAAEGRVGIGAIPSWPAAPGAPERKLSAAWLIEQAGFSKGFPGPGGRVGLSGKHTLALVNRGGTTADLIELAVAIRDGVWAVFGVELHPEPIFVGVSWPGLRGLPDAGA